MIDIMSDYTSIAGQVVNRACEAFEKHGKYISLMFGYGVLLEEFRELQDEVTPQVHFGKDVDYERIFQESLDLAVTAIRMAHFAKSQLPTPEETPKLSSVLGLEWEGKD